MLANTIRPPEHWADTSNPTPVAALCLPTGTRRSIRLRKLSATGLMAEAEAVPQLWTQIEVSLRNIGKVPGFVAWVEDNRFGICFDQNIDPARVETVLN